jgi:hypothetical protein
MRAPSGERERERERGAVKSGSEEGNCAVKDGSTG